MVHVLQSLSDSQIASRHSFNRGGDCGSGVGRAGLAGDLKSREQPYTKGMMDVKNYVKATAANVLLIATGALIGPIVAHSDKIFTSVVHAQSSPAAKASPASSPPSRDPRYEYVQPTISAGTVLFGITLSHKIATDNITVGDIDLLKLHDNTLGLLVSKGLIKSYEASKAVELSKADKPLRVDPGPPASDNQPPKP